LPELPARRANTEAGRFLMALTGFKAQNHPQQTSKRGARPEVDNLATTTAMFAPLHERFRFTLDACALPHNTKLPRYFAPSGCRAAPSQHCMWAVAGECGPVGCRGCEHGGSEPLAIDGLAQSWSRERVWCNPPYSNLEPWVEKAHHEWRWMTLAERRKSVIVMLVPANRCEQGWWQRHVEPHRDRGKDFRVTFLPGRPRFIKHGFDRVEPNQRPPFGCALLIWGRDDVGRLHRDRRDGPVRVGALDRLGEARMDFITTHMSVTPLHPMCEKAEPLTRDEMLDMIRYEGLVGLTLNADIVTAARLQAEGLVEISEMRGVLHIVYTGGIHA